jgi:hypothetical protein
MRQGDLIRSNGRNRSQLGEARRRRGGRVDARRAMKVLTAFCLHFVLFKSRDRDRDMDLDDGSQKCILNVQRPK